MKCIFNSMSWKLGVDFRIGRTINENMLNALDLFHFQWKHLTFKDVDIDEKDSKDANDWQKLWIQTKQIVFYWDYCIGLESLVKENLSNIGTD